MRSTLTTASVVALLATGAGTGTAAARPEPPTARTDAAIHAQTLRSLGLHQRRLTSAASTGVPAPTTIVHVTRAPLVDGGFEWADAGIGAGFAAALLLSAAGVSAVRRHPPMPTHAAR